MLHYAAVFFIIALIAAVFGFGGIAAGATEIAKMRDTILRTKFTELGVIDFEHMPDTEEEYETFALAEGEVASAR